MFKWNKWFMFLILLTISVLLCSSSSFAINTNLTIKDVECYYSEEFTISLHLTDENSSPLNNKKVTITIDGWKFDDLYTDSKGRVDLAVPYDYEGIWYDVGTYKISASFSGSEGYNSSSANGKVTILQIPTKMTMNYDVNSRKVLFSLFDKNNNPVGSGRIDLL
ncbi:MAG: Ig-like domain-containing protein [Methanobrevibacter sp.]|nr:Ig-like domain-containing protein [Methanobrevibacter sp.]